MKVFIAINWFYEGDSNLVGSYEGVFKTRKALVEAITKQWSATSESLSKATENVSDSNLYTQNEHGFQFYKVPVFLEEEDMEVFNGEKTPKVNWGSYCSPSKWEIREEEI